MILKHIDQLQVSVLYLLVVWPEGVAGGSSSKAALDASSAALMAALAFASACSASSAALIAASLATAALVLGVASPDGGISSVFAFFLPALTVVFLVLFL